MRPAPPSVFVSFKRVCARLCLALGLPFVGLSCGDDGPGPPITSDDGVELLFRAPDERVEEPGHLLPSNAAAWSRLALDGWLPDTERMGSATLAWCGQPEARLLLPIAAVGPRELLIEARAPSPGDDEEPSVEVLVHLNGVKIGAFTVEPDLSRYTLLAEAECWRLGDNLLELKVAQMREHKALGFVGIAVSRVEYGVPAYTKIDTRAGTVSLQGGTGVRYVVEQLSQCQLHLQATSGGTGQLEIALTPFNPERSLADRDAARRVRLPVRTGRVDARLPALDAPGLPTEVEIIWSSQDGADAVLRSLTLREEAPAQRPPIIFVSVDTLAARNMSLYGYERETTPVLDALAEEAVVFTQARANAPFTLQSYISQFSGLYPPANRLDWEPHSGRRPAAWELDQLAGSRWTLAEALRAAGYKTAAWVDNPWLARGFGFQQGFEVYDTRLAETPLHEPGGGVHLGVQLLEQWIVDHGAQRAFFTFLQVLDPHAPYHPDPPWRDRFDGDELYDPDRELPVGRDQLHVYGLIPHHVARGVTPSPEPLPDSMGTGQLVAAYDARILQVDAALGELIDFLRDRELFEDTLLIVSADHGESLLTHNYHFDHGSMYEEVLSVPLIVKLPGGAHAGRVVTDAVQLVDLYPTLVELVGLNPSERRGLHGRSLVPLLEGGSLPPAATYSEGGIMEMHALVQDGWKLLEKHPASASLQTKLSMPRVLAQWLPATMPELLGEPLSPEELRARFDMSREGFLLKKDLDAFLGGPLYELYELRSDPGELNDLSEEHPERLSQLLESLDAQRSRAAEARASARFAPPLGLTEEQRSSLSDLGYMDSPDSGGGR